MPHPIEKAANFEQDVPYTTKDRKQVTGVSFARTWATKKEAKPVKPLPEPDPFMRDACGIPRFL